MFKSIVLSLTLVSSLQLVSASRYGKYQHHASGTSYGSTPKGSTGSSSTGDAWTDSSSTPKGSTSTGETWTGSSPSGDVWTGGHGATPSGPSDTPGPGTYTTGQCSKGRTAKSPQRTYEYSMRPSPILGNDLSDPEGLSEK
ncbi:hypothetical protein C8J56DRAFT_881425 [Mycena floridula]|nr:hypothetical protein C8J56DRAFT_881425 [Mycena floridula]